MYGRKPKQLRNTAGLKIVRIIVLIALVLPLFLIYKQYDENILPSVLTMAEFKAKAIATDVMNEAFNEFVTQNNIKSDDLVTYFYNDEGKVVEYGVNTIKINEICTGVMKNMSNKFKVLDACTLEIPIGNLTGSEIFANHGPKLRVKIQPVGTATINYDREFVDTGINQINHRVWLDIISEIQIVIPLATKHIDIAQKFTLVDRVLNGEVPPNFVNVPESNVLDVTGNNTVK